MGVGKVFGSVLAGVSGGAKKYSSLRDEQRQYNMKQTELDAQKVREQNFMRFGKKLEGSGMVDKSGKELTNEELEKGGTALEGLQSKDEYQYGFKKKEKEDAELDQPSQYMNPETKQVYTKGEVEELEKSGKKLGEDYVTITAHKEKREDTETEATQKGREELAELKNKLKSVKDEKKFLADFRKELNSSISPDNSDAQNHFAVGQLINVMSDDPRIMKEKSVKSYMDRENMSRDIMKGFEKGQSLKDIKRRMKKSKSLTEKEFSTLLKILEQKGELEKGAIPGTGYKGLGR